MNRIIGALTLAGTLLVINQVFFLNLFGLALATNSFLYLVAACFLPIVFLRKSPGIIEYILAAITFGLSIWLAYHGNDISVFGWSMVAPTYATWISIIYWLLVGDMLRRTAGKIVAILAMAVSAYPMIAGLIPVAFLQGIQYDPRVLAQVHVMGTESIFGLPFNTAASILVGFLLFGVTLQHTGGAEFFTQLANSLFGRYRGGAAKVSVASSAAMGMMSGSAVSNVLTTGPMTIPTMIKSGFSKKTAGAIEATASSGGSVTPPIMGAAAFLMVSFVGVPYTDILIAALIPAFLYYFGIFMQIDGYSARYHIHGQDRNSLPNFFATLRDGWPYILAIALLTVLLLTAPAEAQVPFWVIAALLLIAFVKPSIHFRAKELGDLIVDAGKTIAQIMGIIAGVGLILGGLTATGVALSLSRDLVALAGDNALLILISGAIACFILGTGLTISASYVFLAIVMVPALTALDVNPIAAHLFVIYWASVSYITPPVGLAAFAAAGISKATAMETCFEAMKFGAVKYLVPFAFVLNPALVAQADTIHIAVAALTSFIAVFALSAMFSGYLQGVETTLNWPLRIILGLAGAAVFLPQWSISAMGVAAIIAVLALTKIKRTLA